MLKKAPPEILSPTELAFMSELNECQLRHYLAERAISLGKHGVSKISEKMGHCKNTIRQGIKELRSGYIPGEGRVRRRVCPVLLFVLRFFITFIKSDKSTCEKYDNIV